MTSQAQENTIEYRVLADIADLEQVVTLEMAVWGLEPRDAVPMNLLRAISLHGGAVISAFDGSDMIGMSVMFQAETHGRRVLWSHMAGVHPDYQSRGIGFGIKQAQRVWALDRGWKEICWTFDPLLRGNANFNLHLLGANAFVYYVDYYGIMQDAINPPIPSDRLEASWKLSDRRVKRLGEGAAPTPALKSLPAEAFALAADAHGNPVLADKLPAGEWALARIPRRSAGLDLPTMTAWRMALRQTLQTAFAQGYVAVDFLDDQDSGVYVLRAPTHWYLYLLKCSDSSLYTGISPNVEQRVKSHNAGRGAAYTKSRRPVELLGAWQFSTHSNALKAELAFKNLSRAQKFGQASKHEPFHGGAPVE